MSALRSVVFLVFQTIVTPVYAAVMLLMFWLPRVPMYRIAASWCRVNLWGARWICGIRHRVIGADGSLFQESWRERSQDRGWLAAHGRHRAPG